MGDVIMIINTMCYVARISEDGYNPLDEEECMTLDGFGLYEYGIENYDPPYNCREWFIEYGSDYSIADLKNSVYKQFGVSFIAKENFDEDDHFYGLNVVLVLGDKLFITFDDNSIKLYDIILNYELKDLKLYILPVFGLGEVLKGKTKSYTFQIRSREGNQHNEPHVHVKGKDGRSGSFKITTAEPFKKSCSLNPREIVDIKKIITEHKDELLILWDKMSDGISLEKYYEIA